MTRRVTFSSGHRYWLAKWSPEENRRKFGPWASPYNHGHNYVLDVTVEGDTDPKTGMVVNIKTIDDQLRAEIVSKFDQKSINDEVAHFAEVPPSLENLISYFAMQLMQAGTLAPEVELVSIRLEEMPTFWANWNRSKMITLTRSYEFAASHRLHSPALSDAENVALFGKCNNLAGHGHNYVLEVTVSGVPHKETGMLVDISKLDEAVHRLVVDRYDHKNLNEDIAEFTNRPTTSEVVAQEIFNRLESEIHTNLERVKLWETARSSFEVSR